MNDGGPDTVPEADRYAGDLKHLEFRLWWMDCSGNIAVVHDLWAHERWARERGLNPVGWVKKTHGPIGEQLIFDRVTQSQLNRLFDYHVACGLKFDPDIYEVV